MCGRLACGLQPKEICNSCCFKEVGSNNVITPKWIDCYNLGKTYKPSYNICPTDVAPVLLSGTHFKSNSRVIAPMVFGIIPYWSKLEEKVKYSTINCRIESIRSSKLYSRLLKKRQRCVVICNGYYEWENQSHHKTPYFIHAEQPKGVEFNNPDTWDQGASGSSFNFKPLKLAALFEISSSDSMEDATLSFTVITKEASSETSWLHGRMPAILDTKEQLDAWLNSEEVDETDALQCIQQNVSVICIAVSNVVNTVANKDISCIKQQQSSQSKKKNMGSVNVFKKWIERGQKRKSNEINESSNEEVKKEKN